MATATTTQDNSVDDLITHEEVEHWSTEALKDFCRKRGYKVTGLKKELVSRVYFLYNHQVPEEPDAKQQEASQKKDYKSLINFKYPATDPFSLKRWVGEKDGLKNWPPVTYIDIHWFLRRNGSVGLTDEHLTAYKNGKAYSYFSCEWLQEVFHTSIQKSPNCCFLKAKCKPSTRINDDPHDLWVKVLNTGEVVSAYCSCMAGLSQTCNHVAALLFKIESAYRLDLSNPAKTSMANQWLSPSGAQGPLNMRLQDMTFTKHSFNKGAQKLMETQRSSDPVTVDDFREILVNDNDTKSFKAFVSSLKQAIPNASVFLPGRSTDANSITESDQGDIGPQEEECLPTGADVMKLAKASINGTEFLEKLKLGPTEVQQLEQKSVGQSSNPLWKTLRRGRITASNFYRVHTRMESLRTRPNLSCDNLINSLLHPTPLDHLLHIKRGQELESSAVEQLTRHLAENGHSNVVVKDCGIIIDTKHSYLGASPDGLVSCDCCGTSLIEIKCPTLDLKDLPYLDAERKLKPKSSYYGQAQGQMLITGVERTWFYIYYPDASSHMQLLEINKRFCDRLRQNLVQFYELHMVTKLVMRQ